MKVVIVHFDNVMHYPPVISLVENFLDHGHKVILISWGGDGLKDTIRNNDCFEYKNIDSGIQTNFFARVINRYRIVMVGRKLVKEIMIDSDLIWTTTDRTVMLLGKLLFEYKHIMQLMELDNYYPYSKYIKWPKFPIARYANKAWKMVVPELNRAYIQKTIWNLNKFPIVLPNKPYRLEIANVDEELEKGLNIIKKETKKIIIYLGIIAADRDLSKIIEAVHILEEEYSLYMLGLNNTKDQREFDDMINKYDNVHYLGFYKSPKHLNFLQYAHIGVLPYKPTRGDAFISDLNAQYCAPNKIFEYCGFDLPMIGSNVLGLKLPFDMYNIGKCYDDTVDSIINTIQSVENNYAEMKNNCKKYYNSYDMKKILESIIETE